MKSAINLFTNQEVMMPNPTERRDIFNKIAHHLRSNLAAGIWLPGEQIYATDVASQLRTSATPVREVLSRLVGEGLIEERRGQGYYIARLQPKDVSDLYELSSHLIGTAAMIINVPPSVPTAYTETLHTQIAAICLGTESGARLADIGADIGLVISCWSRSSVKATEVQRLSNMLAPVRACEAKLIPDLDDELHEYAAVISSGDLTVLSEFVTSFYARRQSLAADLCFLAYENHPRR